jgi:peptidoglycan/LPS O-acetylase OafA/YrhL
MNAGGAPNRQLHQPKYRPDVDGLRAVAVLAVVGFHAFPGTIRGGYVGVDVFFVISGFLISSVILTSLSEGSFTYRQFYARRIKRIFAAPIVVLAACSVAGWFVLLPEDFRQLGKHIAAGAGFVSNFAFWSEASYFDAAADTKPLLHLWSLGIEEQFYIVWPLLLSLAWGRRWRPLALTLAILFCSFALNVVTSRTDPVAAFYSPATRFWELLVGCCLAYVTVQGLDRRKGGDLRSALGLALIAVATIALDRESTFPGWLALLPTVGALLVISAGPQAWLNRTLLSNRVMVWFGLISFPLYLWHWPILSFVRIVGESEHPPREIRVAAVLASIVLAGLTYRFVERPIRFGAYGSARIAALCVLMVAVGGLGYGTYASDGFESRFSLPIQEVARFRYDPREDYRAGTCFLWPDQHETGFKNCIGSAEVFLWGDSHAAQLYPALRKAVPGVAQFTKSLCPPFLGADPKGSLHCSEVNNHVLQVIERYKPARVIIAGAWSSQDWRRLGGTLEALRKIGVGRIDLMGPVPHWTNGLPKALVSYLKRYGGKAPQRMTYGLDTAVLSLDHTMRGFAARYGVNYLSAIEILCNDAGCLTRTRDDLGSLTAFDHAHLTPEGSEYLVSRFPR